MKKGSKIYLSVISVFCLFAIGSAGTYKYLESHNFKPSPPSLGALKKMQVALPKTLTNTKDGHMVQLTVTVQAMNWSEVKLLKEEHSHVMDDLNMTVHADTRSTFINNLPTFKKQFSTQVDKLFPKGNSPVKVYLSSVLVQ